MTASLRKNWRKDGTVLSGALLIALVALQPPAHDAARFAFDHAFNAFQAVYFDSQSFRFLCM